ncbi:hypothetical protein CR513_18256, partial [Mucuna pruriens]
MMRKQSKWKINVNGGVAGRMVVHAHSQSVSTALLHLASPCSFQKSNSTAVLHSTRSCTGTKAFSMAMLPCTPGTGTKKGNTTVLPNFLEHFGSFSQAKSAVESEGSKLPIPEFFFLYLFMHSLHLPSFGEDNNFELRPTLSSSSSQFRRLPTEKPLGHLNKLLRFPDMGTRDSSDSTLLDGGITTWNKCAYKFLPEYFHPSKSNKLKDIMNYSQPTLMQHLEGQLGRNPQMKHMISKTWPPTTITIPQGIAYDKETN